MDAAWLPFPSFTFFHCSWNFLLWRETQFHPLWIVFKLLECCVRQLQVEIQALELFVPFHYSESLWIRTPPYSTILSDRLGLIGHWEHIPSPLTAG